MTIADLALTLARLGFDRSGVVFWLTTTPAITPEELAGRTVAPWATAAPV